MIRLHYANRLENLVAPLADAIATQQRARPLERATIVVPSRVIEHYLKHRVAERIGVAANLDFPFLRRFLAKVIETADPKLQILDVEELELVLFEGLRAGLREESADLRRRAAMSRMANPPRLRRKSGPFASRGSWRGSFANTRSRAARCCSGG